MNHDTQTAVAKTGFAWFLWTLSKMSPLEWVQLIAAFAAFVYTVLQIYVLIRDKFGEGRK